MRPTDRTFQEAVSFCSLFLAGCDEQLTVARRGEGLPDVPTVYAHVGANNTISYIGQTTRLRRRTAQHEVDRAKGLKDWEYVHWFMPGIMSPTVRLQVETILIAIARPKFNKAILLRIGKLGQLKEIRWRKGRKYRG